MTKVSKPKLKSPSVLSVGGLLALMARLTLLYVMEASLQSLPKIRMLLRLASEAEVADVLANVREAAELGELDALIQQQAQFGRRVTEKNK